MSDAGSLADEFAPEALGRRDPDVDQLVVMQGVDWRTYGALRELIDSPGIRMTYLKGALEIFGDGRFRLHALDGDHYRSIDRSELVPGLDFGVMAELVAIPDQHAAVKAFRDRLRAALPTR